MRQPESGSSPPVELTGLTERELEVLTHLARGRSNAEIAVTLFVTPATVKTGLSRLLTKLEGRRPRAARVIAYECGLAVAHPPDGRG